MNILKKLLPLVAAFCVATVIAQAIVLSILWQKGGLTEEKRFRILTVLHDVDVTAIEGELKKGRPDDASDTIRMNRRASNTDELTSREKSFRQSLASYKSGDGDLRDVRRQNELLKTNFDNRLAKLEQEAIDASLLDVRQTLEAVKTKQAKTQILRMIDDDAMDDVIKLVVAMSVEKRKKIFIEFKSAEETEKLHDILRHMRNVAKRTNAGADSRES